MDTSLCPACPAGPINSQPDTVAHTEWHGDEPNHAPACLQGCDANHFCLESNSAKTREAVIEKRQTEAQTG